MATNVIHVRGTRKDVRRSVLRAVQAASGRAAVGGDAAEAMQVRIGMAALAHIRDAFVVKSRGGTDAAGLKWPPLKRSTVAYSRRHPGMPGPGKRAGYSPSWMLTDRQRKRWWELYRIGLARFRGDKERAAKMAWAIAKREGAKTIIGEYGDTPVDILRDTGLLLNSLSPGVSPGGQPDQVFRIGAGEVIVGTNRKWAAAHHQGIPGRLPQRRLWPEPSTWPAEWWADINEQAQQGYIDILISVLTSGS